MLEGFGAFGWWIAVVAFGVIVAGAYALRAVRSVAQGPERDEWLGLADLDAREASAVAPLAVALVVLGVWPGFVAVRRVARHGRAGGRDGEGLRAWRHGPRSLPPALGVLGALAAMLARRVGSKRRAAAVAARSLLVAGAVLGRRRDGDRADARRRVPCGRGCWLRSRRRPACCWDRSLLLGGSRRADRTASGGRLAALVALAAAACAIAAAASDLVLLVHGDRDSGPVRFRSRRTRRDRDGSREASMKWFVQSAVATAVLRRWVSPC